MPDGTTRRTDSGYVEVKHDGRWELEHRVVYRREGKEFQPWREYLPGENVHHIRPNSKDDNRIENLELWVTTQPAGHRVEDVVAYAVEMLQRYAPEKLA